MDPIEIRSFEEEDRSACAAIFDGLPEWFGLAESNAKYLRELSELPAFVATRDGRVCAFTSLRVHNPISAEIEVLAVARELHRRGVGQRLVARLEQELCERGGFELFHVKTLGPSEPDPNYARTRAFYAALGFKPLFETPELWGPENPALVLVKPMQPPGAPHV